MRRLIFLLLVLLPSSAFAQGDVYFRNRGPDPPVPKTEPPPRKQFCAEYGGSDERRDCFLGVDAGRRFAAQYGGMKGWEAGWLRGYAWGLYYEARSYAKDPDLRKQGADSVEGLEGFKKGVAAERKVIFDAASQQGAAAAEKRLDDAFEAGTQPDTTLDPASIPVGEWKPTDDPYEKYVGTDITMGAVLERDLRAKTISPFRTSSFELISQSNPPTYDIQEYVFADGVYAVDPQPVYDVDKAVDEWQHSKYGPSPDSTVDKKLEEDGFRRAYEHYVQYNYTKQFYRALDTGTERALPLGQKVGKRLAVLEAQFETFNDKFNRAMVDVHRKAVLQGYSEGWKSTMEEARKPRLKLVDVEVFGKSDDGIVSPGEPIGFRAMVENRGLSALSKGRVSLESKLVRTVKPGTVDVGAFTKTPIDTGLIAQVSPKARPGQNAELVAHLGEAKIPLEAVVHSPVEFAEVKLGSLDLADGLAVLEVSAASRATVPVDDVQVAIAMDGKLKRRVNLGGFAAKQKKDGNIKVNGLDILSYHPTRSVLQARLYRGKQVMDQTRLPMKIPDPTEQLIRAFDRLAAGAGYVPEGASREDRMKAVQNRIVQLATDEVRKNAASLSNVWKSSPESTVPGKILALRLAKSEEAKKYYAGLGTALCDLDGEFSRINFQKKKAWRELCERIRDAK